MTGTKTEQLKKIRDELLVFKKSPLYQYRTENNYYPVIGEGDHDADIIFIGEAPGEKEAETARPFCGRAGKMLTELIEGIGLSREEVYITNVLKDRPPGNRDPKPEEIAAYAPFLKRQIEIIEPNVIATLGRFSMEFIMDHVDLWDQLGPISKLHGKVFETEWQGTHLRVVPLYHPAVALYNGSMRDVLKKDFEVLKQFISKQEKK